MTFQAQYFMPDDGTLRELGRLQVLHSQLDHALRLAIKRMLGISVDDSGYWNETRGMTAALRDKARKLIAERYANDDDKDAILNKVLDDAEGATELRNRALHSVWMNMPGAEPFLHDRDNALKAHVNFQLPSVATLADVSQRLQRIHRVLDSVTRDLL
ncbi:MAG: hypothetical protein ACWA6Y_10295 [Polaromonas sp.]